MKDQVDALVERGHSGDAAQQHARPGRAAGPADRDRGGAVRPRLRRPRAVPEPSVRRDDGEGQAGPAGDRRGALHQRVGPRLPARLRADRPGPSTARVAPLHRPDGDGDRPRPPRHRRPARPARPGPVRHRLRPAEPELRGHRRPARRRQARGRWPRLAGQDAGLGDRLCLQPGPVRDRSGSSSRRSCGARRSSITPG